MKKLKRNINWALYYQQIGWMIVPADRNGECYLYQESPYLQGNLKATAEQIKEWWKKWPEAIPAVLTGLKSNVISFNIDPEKASSPFSSKYKSFNRIYKIGLRSGVHLISKDEEFIYFFLHPKYYVESRIGMKFSTGTGIIAAEGMILLPFSSLDKGKDYKWVVDPTSDNITPVPEWLELEIPEYQKYHGKS